MTFLYIVIALIVAFGLGVFFAPVVRRDYAEFKAYVEQKLKDAEAKAKAGIQADLKKL